MKNVKVKHNQENVVEEFNDFGIDARPFHRAILRAILDKAGCFSHDGKNYEFRVIKKCFDHDHNCTRYKVEMVVVSDKSIVVATFA